MDETKVLTIETAVYVVCAVCAVCAVAIAALVWWLNSPSKRGPSLPVKRRRIVGLDLAPVRTKAMKRHGWTEEKALALESEYKDFLILLAEHPGQTVSPWT